MRSRLLTCSGFVAALVVVAGCVSALDAVGDADRVATDGDPHRVTVRALREELDRAGSTVRFVRAPGSSTSTVAGVATSGGAAVGFEFQVFDSSDVATIRWLGRLRSTDFGWRPARYDPLYRTWIRGVLGNVAYAQYEVETDRQLLAEPARSEIIRGLDDALFRAFPTDDPFVHARLPAKQR